MNKLIIRKRQKSQIFFLIYNHIKENKKNYLIATCLFFIGFIIAILFINNINQQQVNEISEYIKELNDNLQNVENLDYLELLKQSIYKNTIIILIIWIASSTIIGIPVIYAEIIYRGFVLGYTICSVLFTFGIKDGTIYNISTLLLHNIIFIPVLFATAVKGMKAYQSIINNRKKENIKLEFLRHTLFMVIMLILLIISSVIEVYFSTNLSKFILKFIKI